MGSFSIELTQNEALYLSDALSMNAQGPMPDVRPYPHLLLKIGSAVLSKTFPVQVALAEEELWMVREVAKTGVMVGVEKVGLALARKAYEGLISVCGQDAVHDAVLRSGETREEEPRGAGEAREALKDWGGGEHDA